MADNKVETQNWVSAEGTVSLVPVPTPAGAEAARAAATSSAAAEVAPCAAEATALVFLTRFEPQGLSALAAISCTKSISL